MRIASVSQAAFAAALIAVGLHGLVTGDSAGIWGPVPAGLPGRAALPWACGAVTLACGAGLLWRASTAVAARVLLAWLMLWLLAMRLPAALMAPAVEGYWSGCGETAVVAAAAWIVWAGSATARDRPVLRRATGDPGRRLARALYGLALIPFGVAHFVYAKQTAALVPGWLAAPAAWAAFTGGAYIAAGVALLVDRCARPAAVLSALQIALFTALVWLPVVASGHADASQWSETVISCALTAAAWVIADSWRDPVRRDGPSATRA
jgi:uncharacterized membrane protein